MADSRWQDLFEFLKSKGFDVYSPGIKVGECTSSYVVVKGDGSSIHSSFSTDVDLYSIMCYVPKQAYSKLEPMMQDIKKAMKEIYPEFISYGLQTPSFYDDSVKAHMSSITYKNYKKI